MGMNELNENGKETLCTSQLRKNCTYGYWHFLHIGVFASGISGGGILYIGILSVGFLWHYAYWHYSQWRFVLRLFIRGVLSRDLLRDLGKLWESILSTRRISILLLDINFNYHDKVRLLCYKDKMSFLPFKIINWKGMKFAVTGQLPCEETKQ